MCVVSPVLTSPPLTSLTHLTITTTTINPRHVQRGSSTTAASTSWYTFVTIFETHRELPHQQFFFENYNYKASKTGFFSIGYFSFKSTLKCFKAIPTAKYLNANPAFKGKNKSSSSLIFLSIRCNVY